MSCPFTARYSIRELPAPWDAPTIDDAVYWRNDLLLRRKSTYYDTVIDLELRRWSFCDDYANRPTGMSWFFFLHTKSNLWHNLFWIFNECTQKVGGLRKNFMWFSRFISDWVCIFKFDFVNKFSISISFEEVTIYGLFVIRECVWRNSRRDVHRVEYSLRTLLKWSNIFYYSIILLFALKYNFQPFLRS